MTQHIRLPDGRTLHFAEYGDARGLPMLFCHGLPGSRLQVSEHMSEIARRLNVRVIAPDRPGYGFSDPVSGGYIDSAVDIAALLNHLEISKSHVLGYSIGASYALACAISMPDRITCVSLVAGMAPNVFEPAVNNALPQASRDVFAVAHNNPEQLSAVLKSVAPDSASLFAIYNGTMSVPDNQLLAQEHIAAGFQHDCAETLRQGHDAASADLVRFVQPWDFDLASIQTQMHIWHGEEDINAPVAMARYFSANLPNATLHVLSGEGHLCLISHWEDILASLT